METRVFVALRRASLFSNCSAGLVTYRVTRYLQVTSGCRNRQSVLSVSQFCQSVKSVCACLVCACCACCALPPAPLENQCKTQASLCRACLSGLPDELSKLPEAKPMGSFAFISFISRW